MTYQLRNQMKKLLSLVVFFLTCQVIISQTTIPGGMVNGVWDAAGSPYLIEDAIAIDYGQTLIIEAGCEIIFQPGIEFLINGTLQAQGSQADSIRFYCSSGQWEGLQIVGLWEFNNSTFEFCTFENASVGLLTFYTGSVTVSNCRFSNNTTGMHIQHSSAYLNNIEVTNNTDAGIKMTGNCCGMEFILSSFMVSNNGARGLEFNFDSGGTQEISNGIISNNACGGVFSSSVDGFATFSNLEIKENGPTDLGGGMHIYAGCLIQNCLVKQNIADYGAGIYLRTDIDIQNISNCQILQNESVFDGGGIYLADGATNVYNCDISENAAGNNGGGIYIEKVNFIHGIQIRNLQVAGNEAINLGGGLHLENVDADLDIFQSTIVNNTSGTNGGAISFLSNPFNETIELNSCILCDNLPDEIHDPDGGFMLNYSNFQGGWSGLGTENIAINPMFISDGMFGFDLKEESPCINSGDPAIIPGSDETDLAGRSRLYNDTIDMGAFETNQQTGPTWGLSVSAWLEGAFQNGGLISDLRTMELLPKQQPFTPSPWNYNGNDTISEDQSGISDWLLLELFDAGCADNLCPCKKFYQKAFPISVSGNLINESGSETIRFIHQFDDSLYIALRHRNHLDIVTAKPINESNGYFHCDFRESAGNALGGTNSQVEVAPGQWAMIAGDINQNDTVSESDLISWVSLAGQKLYHPADLDFNGEINNNDKNLLLLNNFGKFSSLPVEDSVFNCGEFLHDTINNICYPTVLIGGQCWMAANINTGTRIDSTQSPLLNDTIEKYCYADLEENCDTYGALYTWDEMMNYNTTAGAQGICPDGWHIPTDDEWKLLEGFSDTQFPSGDPEWDIAGWRGLDAGLQLKNESGWTQNGNGSNLYDFNALPAGYLEYTGGYFRITEGAYFWSSTESDTDHAWRRGFHFSKNGVHRWAYEKTAARSVRCLKD